MLHTDSPLPHPAFTTGVCRCSDSKLNPLNTMAIQEGARLVAMQCHTTKEGIEADILCIQRHLLVCRATYSTLNISQTCQHNQQNRSRSCCNSMAECNDMSKINCMTEMGELQPRPDKVQSLSKWNSSYKGPTRQAKPTIVAPQATRPDKDMT